MNWRLAVLIVVGVLTGGCATSFTGSAHIEGGRQACESKCRGQGMEVAGMVYMGEYSSACVCEIPGKSASAHNVMMAAAGATGGAAGVIMQQQQSQRNSTHFGFTR